MTDHKSTAERQQHDKMVAEAESISPLSAHFLNVKNSFESLAFCVARWLYQSVSSFVPVGAFLAEREMDVLMDQAMTEQWT